MIDCVTCWLDVAVNSVGGCVSLICAVFVCLNWLFGLLVCG